MKQLIELIEEEFCESDGWFRIVSADWIADELRLDLSVCLCEEKEPQLWEITCESVYKELIFSEFADYLSVENKHPLLARYKEPEVDLSFSKNRICSNELFGIVLSTCFKYLGEHPVSDLLNQSVSSDGICSSEYGILGRFPESVANEICRLLQDKDISIKQLQSYTPKYWDGEQHKEYPSNLEVLVIGGSYVVGTNFSAVRA